ncbi:cholinesterase [Mycena rebaudengoi]|nr:cholinesterase [Mycena rebaudengoi]
MRYSTLFALCFWAHATLAAISSPAGVNSDLRLLFQNDLDWHTTAAHPSFLLVSARSHADALSSCAKLSESLAATNGTFFRSDIEKILAYIALDSGRSRTQKYWIGGSPSQHGQCTAISISGLITAPCTEKLPAICANSAPHRISGQTDLSSAWQIRVASQKLSFTGTRDHLSFRFLGIPYANNPQRFTYSSAYTGPSDISALNFGSACAQGNSASNHGSEDCLFLNVFTPFLPAPSKRSSTKLLPVMAWIHGGGFTGGEASDAVYDGGNLASRGDVVVVSINYRLSTLGFLALNDGKTKGNYGIGDQITALNWVRTHIASFGGDPDRVTIFGQSAGAGSVRALLGAPPAFGLFKGAIAESNLGGFGYAHTYSDYFTIEQEVDMFVSQLVVEVGCGNVTATELLRCLREVPWVSLQGAGHAPRYIVVDGNIIKKDRLAVDGTGPAAPAHAIFGWMAGDGVDFAGSFPQNTTTQSASIQGIGADVTSELARAIIESGEFPFHSTGNATLDLFNVTGRVANDAEFVCIDQATAFSASKHNVFKSMWTYQFDRSYMGFEPIPGICDPPATPSHPFGDPSLPYFACHSGELVYTFGTLGQSSLPFRDEFDQPFEQAILDMWVAFARTYNPNPSPAFLEARGYTSTSAALKRWGPWKDVKSDAPVRILDWPSRGSDWLERRQCEILGIPLDFYESG